MPGLRERALGAPEQADWPSLGWALRLGGPELRARAARSLAARFPESIGALEPFVSDPEPGVRRATAQAIARAPDPALRGPLLEQARRERALSPLGAQCAALVRCGVGRPEVQGLLSARAGCTLRTARGPRAPETSLGRGPEVALDALRRALEPAADGTLTPWPALHAVLRARAEAEDHQALEDLAALGAPEDHALLHALLGQLGRRGLNSAITAMGLHGDPRWLPELLDPLVRMDLDPARGLAWRRLGAFALGTLGFRRAVRPLLRAVEIEASEHEGRPGAGLGIQFPVRAACLWALGELQDPAAVPVLVAHLHDLHGSALGGFHLPAMGALLKIGAPARSALERLARRGPEDAAQNARGVLEVLA